MGCFGSDSALPSAFMVPSWFPNNAAKKSLVQTALVWHFGRRFRLSY